MSEQKQALPPEKVAPTTAPAEAHPTRWHCDTYCRKVRHVHCPGEAGKDASAPDPCPYLEEMLY